MTPRIEDKIKKTGNAMMTPSTAYSNRDEEILFGTNSKN
jgi:hypothetical protein